MAHLKFANAFGEETIELPARSVAQPFTIGRDSDCDLPVPSATVAPRHCLLFQHKGRWAAQDAGSTTGTFLNGVRLSGVQAVRDGDVLTLGQEADPPTIVLEGADLGSRPVTPSAAGAAPAAYVASVVAPPPAEEEPYVAEVIAAPPQDQQQTVPPADDDWFANAAPAAKTGARGRSASSKGPDTRYYVPKRKGMSPLGWVVTILAAGGIGYVGYYLYQQGPREVMAPTPATTQAIVDDTNSGPNTDIFSAASHDLKKKNKPGNPVAVADTSGAPAAPEAPAAPVVHTAPVPRPPENPDADPTIPSAPVYTEAQNEEKESDGWKNIESARMTKQGLQIVKACQDYLEFNPDTKLKADLDKYVDEGCDILWWTRVEQLCKDDDDLNDKIDGINRDYAVSHDDAFKKDLAAQRDQARADLAHNKTELHTAMGYPGDKPPNIFDVPAMAKLRAARDPKAFVDFKKNAARSIHLHNRPPWDQ